MPPLYLVYTLYNTNMQKQKNKNKFETKKDKRQKKDKCFIGRVSSYAISNCSSTCAKCSTDSSSTPCFVIFDIFQIKLISLRKLAPNLPIEWQPVFKKLRKTLS